jgi:hypothetical protein
MCDLATLILKSVMRRMKQEREREKKNKTLVLIIIMRGSEKRF